MATWLATNMLVTTIKKNYIHKTKEHWLVFLIYFMHLINTQNMEVIKLVTCTLFFQ